MNPYETFDENRGRLRIADNYCRGDISLLASLLKLKNKHHSNTLANAAHRLYPHDIITARITRRGVVPGVTAVTATGIVSAYVRA